MNCRINRMNCMSKLLGGIWKGLFYLAICFQSLRDFYFGIIMIYTFYLFSIPSGLLYSEWKKQILQELPFG